MNHKNHGSRKAPKKRRRGRSRKQGSEASQQKMSGSSCSGAVMNLSQGTVETENCDNVTVGTMVSGVVTGTLGGTYFVDVQIPGTDTPLSGCFFTLERLALATEENGVAPQVSMMKQDDIPLPSFRLERSVNSFVPKQSPRQTVKSESFTFEEKVLPTGLLSGSSAPLGNQCAFGIPMQTVKSESFTFEEKVLQTGHPSGISGPPANQCVSGIPMADLPINKAMKLVSVIKKSNEEVTTGQQAVSLVNVKKEFADDQLKSPKVELVKPEPMPFEQTSEGSNFLEKNDSAVAGVADVNANQTNGSFVDSVKSEKLI